MSKFKKHLFVVDYWEDTEKNFKTLQDYKNSNNANESDFYNSLILNGICFLAIRNNNNYKFGPSRFIGFHNNTIISHKSSHIYGTETNGAISFLLGYEPVQDDCLEDLYFKFCFNNGINPRTKGSFGKDRKYWYKTNIDDEIFHRFEDIKIHNKNMEKIKINFDIEYENWKFDIIEREGKLLKGSVKVPLFNKQIGIYGNRASELLGVFEWNFDNHSYNIAIDKYELMTKVQRYIVIRNLRLKLKEILPNYKF